jgi:hypothetical protein
MVPVAYLVPVGPTVGYVVGGWDGKGESVRGSVISRQGHMSRVEVGHKTLIDSLRTDSQQIEGILQL